MTNINESTEKTMPTSDMALKQSLQAKMVRADQHIQAAEFAAANAVLLAALKELGDRYIDPEAIDETGMRLVAAEAEEKQGRLQNAVTIRRRMLEARLSLWDRKLSADVGNKAR